VIKNNGNVGIGTTSPDTPLVVYKTGNAKIKAQGSGDGANFAEIALWSDEATDKKWEFAHRQAAGELNNLAWYYYNGSSWETIAQMMPGGNVWLGGTVAKTSPVMAVQSTGNVGIGTTGPQQKLHVANAGDVYLRLQNTTNRQWDIGVTGGNLTIGDVTDGTALQINPQSQSITLRATKGAYFATTGGTGVGIGYSDPGTAKLAISGNVGIGTTEPEQLLSLARGNVALLDINMINTTNYDLGIQGRKARGTFPSIPSSVASGDKLLVLRGQGYTSSAATYKTAAEIRFEAGWRL
jgi:hypothetical protein